ncbi:MAG: hypothetical protein ACJAVK_003620, partial [Akkermansiaceae bacterium]
MCNAFNTAKNPDDTRLPQCPGKTKLIRRTDQAPVALPSGEIV